jgi:hypothetical protein
MTEQSKWVSEDTNQAVLQGIYDIISQHMTSLHSPERAQELKQTIQEKQVEIEKQYANWIDDEPSRFHLRLMSLLLASYRVLQNVLPKDDTLALLKKAVIEPNRQVIQEGVRYALDYAPDPMSVLINASKEREENFFGRTFTFEPVQDDDKAYLLHVKQCFYHRFSVENGAPELMQILCEWDWIWADAIEPQKHGFSFELPTTLGYGGDVCRFYLRRGS